MTYFIFLLVLSSSVWGYEYYEKQNLENFNDYKNPNLMEQNFAKVIYNDELGHGSYPEVNQPLCATNGQLYTYFKDQWQFDERNYGELIQGRHEYYECPLHLCKPNFEQCPHCANIHDPVRAMELLTHRFGNLPNPCEVNRNACFTSKINDVISHGPCSHEIAPSKKCPTYCTLEYAPICARFNNELREFPNYCEYERSLCESNIKWQITQFGSCFGDQTPICSQYQTTSDRVKDFNEFGNNCHLQKTTIDWPFVHEAHPKFCTNGFNPICTRYRSNGYQFQRSRLEANIDWQILHFDNCSVDESNADNFLGFQALCASNGRINETFQNIFQLQQEAQRTGIEWSIIHTGVCSLLDNSTTNSDVRNDDIYAVTDTASKLSYPYFGYSYSLHQPNDNFLSNTNALNCYNDNGVGNESPDCNSPTHDNLYTSKLDRNNQLSTLNDNQWYNYPNQPVSQNYIELSQQLQSDHHYLSTPRNAFSTFNTNAAEIPSYSASQYYTRPSDARIQHNTFEYLTALSSMPNSY